MTTAVSATALPWRALRPFGVEIQHDLSAPLTEAQQQRFVALLWQHNLILARKQTLSMERQRELCSLAGQILIREGETGYLSTAGGASTSTSELSWHANAAYTDAPFDAIALHAVDVIDDASFTAFASAEDAFRTLPAGLHDRLKDDRQIEMISPAYDALGGRTCDRRDPVAMKRGEMPSINTNPHIGRTCIWASELQASRIWALIGRKAATYSMSHYVCAYGRHIGSADPYLVRHFLSALEAADFYRMTISDYTIPDAPFSTISAQNGNRSHAVRFQDRYGRRSCFPEIRKQIDTLANTSQWLPTYTDIAALCVHEDGTREEARFSPNSRW